MKRTKTDPFRLRPGYPVWDQQPPVNMQLLHLKILSNLCRNFSVAKFRLVTSRCVLYILEIRREKEGGRGESNHNLLLINLENGEAFSDKLLMKSSMECCKAYSSQGVLHKAISL